MHDEIPDMNTYPLEEPTPRPSNRRTTGVGIGVWLALWGLIFFMFEAYSRLSGWLMWAFRIAGFLCLLLAALIIGMSIENQEK